MTLEDIKDKVIMTLVNTAMNENKLKCIPHRQYMDLSVIYRLVVDSKERCLISSIISNKFADTLEITEEVLFKLATENTKHILTPTIQRIEDMFKGFFGIELPTEVNHDMYVLSNRSGIFGAAGMLYDEELQKLAERLGSDLYILPSSIHEIIAVSAAGKDPNELARMVQVINSDEVKPEDRLSGQIYFYDRGIRKLSMATDIVWIKEALQ